MQLQLDFTRRHWPLATPDKCHLDARKPIQDPQL